MLVAGIAIGAVVTAVITTSGTSPADDDSTSRLGSVRASCGDWMSSPRDGTQIGDQWCSDMFAWMSEQTTGSMSHSMMWTGPERLSAACRRWVRQEGATAGSTLDQRCIDMVAWMDRRMSGPGDTWMMQDR